MSINSTENEIEMTELRSEVEQLCLEEQQLQTKIEREQNQLKELSESPKNKQVINLFTNGKRILTHRLVCLCKSHGCYWN